MKLTFLGHASFLIEYNGKTIVLDPFISQNPLAESINVDEIRCDYILITHAHGDHIADVEAIAKNNPEAVLVSNYEIAVHFSEKNILWHPLNHGGFWDFGFAKIRYVNAVHSSTFPDGKSGGLPGGFVLWAPGIPTLYISGDTALTMDMKLIPMVGPTPDVCIFPIGGNFTMDYNDACLASDFVGCNTVVGCHYDTFGWIKIDTEAAMQAFSKAGKRLILPEIGGVVEFL